MNNPPLPQPRKVNLSVALHNLAFALNQISEKIRTAQNPALLPIAVGDLGTVSRELIELWYIWAQSIVAVQQDNSKPEIIKPN